MKERPINMRAEEVRAILAGRKTQLRRVFKFRETNQPPACPDQFNPQAVTQPCPFGAPGDRLWVRECWKPTFEPDTGFVGISFFAGGMPHDDRMAGVLLDGRDRWRSSVHMPRWACRIILEVVSVRVQRLQDISEEDAKAEGLWPSPHNGLEMVNGVPYGNAQLAFRALWQSINGPRSWDENPWVWVVEFRRLEGAQ